MSKKDNISNESRRDFLKATAATGVAATAPMFFVKDSYAMSHGKEFRNAPKGKSVTLGFNVPQSGAYADEGADELRAYKLAVKHLNGEGDGGMMNTMKPMSLKGNGILGRKLSM